MSDNLFPLFFFKDQGSGELAQQMLIFWAIYNDQDELESGSSVSKKIDDRKKKIEMLIQIEESF